MRSHFEKYTFLVFFPDHIATAYMQKYITAVSSKLLWLEKWYIIKVWRYYMTLRHYMTS